VTAPPRPCRANAGPLERQAQQVWSPDLVGCRASHAPVNASWTQPSLREASWVGGVVTVNDVLDGHVALDLDCLDRICLDASPRLQTSAQVVAFLSAH
jgi:hypothetical protein